MLQVDTKNDEPKAIPKLIKFTLNILNPLQQAKEPSLGDMFEKI